MTKDPFSKKGMDKLNQYLIFTAHCDVYNK